MKILHVIHRYPPAIGGSESWCAGLARWQAARGHDVTVLTLAAVEEQDLWEERREPTPAAVGVSDVDRGVHVRRCAVGWPGPVLRKRLGQRGLWAWTGALSAEFCGRLVRLALANDVVHAHTVPLAHPFVAWLAARVARRPFVLTPYFHCGDRDHEHPSVRWLLRRADRVLVLTAAERDALVARDVAPDRLVTVSVGVDAATITAAPQRDATRAALGIPPEVALVSFIGRKAALKGIDVLFRALPFVRHRPSPVLAVAGPATDWYRSLERPAGPVRIIDLPALSDAAKSGLLAASDVLVLPSRHESFGIVFLEAWAAGVPVLGADIPAVREAVGDAGTLFRTDDPADLAARIDAVLADPAGARSQVARGRTRIAAAHTWDHVGMAVELVYRDARRRAESGVPSSDPIGA